MTQEELDLLIYLEQNSPYSSNEFGINPFIIEEKKSLKDNLEKLIEINIENAKEAERFSYYDN
jgi:hypothetical protein